MDANVRTRPVAEEASVALETNLNLGEIDTAATRLRSWALIRGETITGNPFLCLPEESGPTVNLPVSGTIAPHPDTGLVVERLPAGSAVVVEDVPFERIPDVLNQVRSELEHPAAAAEFRPSGPGFQRGAVVWRLG